MQRRRSESVRSDPKRGLIRSQPTTGKAITLIVRMPGSDDNSDDRQLLLERLSFDGTISRVFTIYFRLFETVTGLSFLVLLVPIAFISFYFMKMLQDELGLDMSQVQIDPTYAMNHISEIFVYSFLKPMPLVPFEWIVEACTIHAVAALYLGNRNVSMSECFMGVIKRMLSFIALTVIVSLIVGVSYCKLCESELLIFTSLCISH